jgi:hypothetical protein
MPAVFGPGGTIENNPQLWLRAIFGCASGAVQDAPSSSRHRTTSRQVKPARVMKRQDGIYFFFP